MSAEANNSQINKWTKFKTVAEASIALVGLFFTVVFGYIQKKNADATLQLAHSNLKLAKSQVQVSLLPALSNEDACQRIVALFLAKNLDVEFCVEAARSLVMNDPDEAVREKARSILKHLSLRGSDDVKEKAQKGANQYDLASELLRSGLVKKLTEAKGHMEGGAPGGIEQALEIYHDVINQLSNNALEKIDRSLLLDAQEDEKGQYKEHAARKYRLLFQEILSK